MLGAVATVDGRRPPTPPASSWSPGTRRWSRPGTATACTSTRRASASCPRASTSRPERAAPGDAVIVSGPDRRCTASPCSACARASSSAPTSALGHRRARRARGGDAGRRTRSGDMHVLRDPTRGGLAASRMRDRRRRPGWASSSTSAAIPVPEAVRAACGFLGLDPLAGGQRGQARRRRRAGGGRAVLAAMRSAPARGCGAVIGTVCAEHHPGVVVARTGLGAHGSSTGRSASSCRGSAEDRPCTSCRSVPCPPPSPSDEGSLYRRTVSSPAASTTIASDNAESAPSSGRDSSARVSSITVPSLSRRSPVTAAVLRRSSRAGVLRRR